MKIRILLLDKDSNYLERLVGAFNTMYPSNLEIHSFTNLEKAMDCITKNKIDVFISSDMFDVDTDSIPERCGFAYFVDRNDVDFVNDKPAICKFQKVEFIYKHIINVYSEVSSAIKKSNKSDSENKVILFSSFSGGVGTSSVAVACAKKVATLGRKVLYLNLEKTGDPELYFSAEGNFTLSDIIYALKSKKSNLFLKIQSTIKQSSDGVYFFAAPKMALDFMELKTSEIELLMDTLTKECDYDLIIVDLRFDFDALGEKIWKRADSVVIVSDGSEVSNSKTERAFNAMVAMEDIEETYGVDKIKLIYNKFSNKTSKSIVEMEDRLIGGIPKFEHATTLQVVEQIQNMNIFDGLINERGMYE